MSLSANLKRLRNEAGLTQFQLAERSHVSYESIQRYEQGKQLPRLHVAERLARFFDMTVDQLKAPQAE